VPGQTKPGSISQGLAELVDLFPTLAELCGVKPPADIQGQSLVPMLKDPNAPGKEVVYTVVTRGMALGRAVRTNRWRYALWPDGEELYDLENDIEEHHNLAESKKYAALLETMRGHLAHAESKAASKAL
jgi:arylsulfatase A-like enzyme